MLEVAQRISQLTSCQLQLKFNFTSVQTDHFSINTKTTIATINKASILGGPLDATSQQTTHTQLHSHFTTISCDDFTNSLLQYKHSSLQCKHSSLQTITVHFRQSQFTSDNCIDWITSTV